MAEEGRIERLKREQAALAAQIDQEEGVADNKIGKRVFYACLAFFLWICWFLLLNAPAGLHGE